ncbi:hypothetical protein CROQUDRAFT_96640 [Cronartium quercuum f. sp. fusiforme G11]|uniref:Uncharacterized protein n=1 Tax=Cronartium quercuum f. sp. fusiforme G11 TaxID=708437 RepID=A0A9P6NFN0_9BASI|nr:hypothetical protein CROQUDRAFT_96640 [Cronartium quercuum f. sp. fusiforme G11]
MTLDATETKFISWKAHLWDMIDFVTMIKNYLSTKQPADKECYDEKTFDYIVLMFHFPSWTSHMTTWQELGNMKFEPGDSLNEYLSKVQVKIDELDRTGFEWTKDSILGIQIQLGLPTSGEFSFSNVNMILDACLCNSQETKVMAWEMEEAIQVEYH